PAQLPFAVGDGHVASHAAHIVERDGMFRPLIGALHEELRAVLADDLHAALDRAVGMADVAVLHPESSDSLSVIVRPMGRERDADVPDRALVARGAVGPARFR